MAKSNANVADPKKGQATGGISEFGASSETPMYAGENIKIDIFSKVIMALPIVVCFIVGDFLGGIAALLAMIIILMSNFSVVPVIIASLVALFSGPGGCVAFAVGMALSLIGYFLVRNKNPKMQNTSVGSVVLVRIVGVAMGVMGFFISDALQNFIGGLTPSLFSTNASNSTAGSFVPTPPPTDTPFVSEETPVTVDGDPAALTPLASAMLKYNQNKNAWDLWADVLVGLSEQYGDTLVDAAEIRDDYLSSAPQTECIFGNSICTDYNFWHECLQWGWNCQQWSYSQAVLDAADQREQDHIDFVVELTQNHLDNEPTLTLTTEEATAISGLLAARAAIVDNAVGSMAIADDLTV